MDDFFKQFRDNLESRPEPAFEEKDWRGLERQLGQLGQKRPVAMAWWWVLPFLILLLGMNAFVLFEQRKMNRQFNEMGIFRDTIYQTRVIYQTDTIYQAEVIRESAEGAPASGTPAVSFSGWQSPSRAPLYPFLAAGQPSAGFFIPEDSSPSASLLSNRHGAISQPLPGAPDEQPASPSGLLAPLPGRSGPFFLPGQPVGRPELPVEPVLAKRKKSMIQYVYPLRPKGLQLGLNGGAAFPFSQNLSRQAGGSAGLQVAIEFSPNIRMLVDAGYFKIHIEANQMDASIGVPVIEPPTDDFIFSKAEVPQPTLQFSAGMQYLFLNASKWSPFAGLGYGTASLLPHDVIYEFKNPLSGEEWNFDGSVSGSMWQTGFILFQGGVEYEFSRQWNGQLVASYRTNWNNFGSLSPRIFGIRGGLMYRF